MKCYSALKQKKKKKKKKKKQHSYQGYVIR